MKLIPLKTGITTEIRIFFLGSIEIKIYGAFSEFHKLNLF
jgi:hypothetical protein